MDNYTLSYSFKYKTELDIEILEFSFIKNETHPLSHNK